MIKIILSVMVLVALCFGGYYIYKRYKRRSNTSETIVITTNKNKVGVQLNAVAKIRGSNANGYETEEELLTRLRNLDMESYKALNVDEMPWTIDEWFCSTHDEYVERMVHELSMYYSQRADGIVFEKQRNNLYREFEV